ncbi:MAG: DUF3343 domain-containing protein [Holophaga sp.]|nr:DUF3343 domain-containing protein [Holophaga sp.]
MDFIATFASSHAALRAEQACLGEALPVELIPVPRQIHSDCGFCLLVDGGPDPAETARRLDRLRSGGARELWRITETQTDPSSRKVKSYERIP